jgi:hypothetical protein
LQKLYLRAVFSFIKVEEMSKIEIRKVTAADIAILQDIGRQTFYETYADMNTEADMQKYLDERRKCN